MNKQRIFSEIERLRKEPAAAAEIRTERGAPRLFINGEETYPLLAWSWSLAQAKEHHLDLELGEMKIFAV